MAYKILWTETNGVDHCIDCTISDCTFYRCYITDDDAEILNGQVLSKNRRIMDVWNYISKHVSSFAFRRVVQVQAYGYCSICCRKHRHQYQDYGLSGCSSISTHEDSTSSFSL